MDGNEVKTVHINYGQNCEDLKTPAAPTFNT